MLNKILKITFCATILSITINAAEPMHVTYLWHMHQPVYYPYLSPQDADSHYSFSVPGVHNDRSGPYTSWPKDAVEQGTDMDHSGAQCSFSGSLGENLNNLWGHSSSAGWDDSYDWARNGLRTSLDNPRLDMVGIAYHHSLMPLTCYESMVMQIKLHKNLYSELWDSGGEYSKGFWPPECAFADWIIPALVDEGMEWVFIDNIHFDRACENYPYSSGGNLFEPNKADIQNPDPGTWVQLNNIWAPTKVSAPWGYQPHNVQYIDPWSNPSTPSVKKIIGVPAARYEGNEDGRGGYGAFNLDIVWDPYVQSVNTDSAHPMLLVCHHDGDNYGGGTEAYYHGNYANLLNMIRGNGNYDQTSVQDYLSMYPVDANDIIHAEPGSWAGADNGDPEFKKWNADPSADGTCPDRFSSSVLVAAQNRVLHAESLETYAAINDVQNGSGNDTAKAWHFYLQAETSCHWYWDNSGEVWDGNVTRACNLASIEADKVIARHSGTDARSPSIYPPQREPYNPGGDEWGTVQPSDFEVWSFAYDVSGLASVQLVWRTDKDGANPINSYQNELYASGTEVNAWNYQNMSASWAPNKTGDVPDPSYRAQYYSSTVSGQTNVLVDYFIQAIDTKGNTNRSHIMHVWVGQSQGGGGTAVTYNPNPPVRGSNCTITYDSQGRSLSSSDPVYIHLGANGWSPTIAPNPVMSGSTGGNWTYTFFVSNDWTIIDSVFTDGGSLWDNNDGQDWHVSTAAGNEPPAASFSGTPRSGNAPLEVVFTDTSTGVISWRKWNFGDGIESSATHPLHTYTDIGQYTVSLTISNSYGNSSNVQSNYITVTSPTTPQADFTGTPRVGTSGTTVQFSETCPGGAVVTAWNWNFGDGGSSTEENPAHLFSLVGSYSVTLAVTGPGGSSTNTKSGYINISEEFLSNTDGTNILFDFAGAPFVLQDTPTGFGDATSPGAGSELDALYVTNTLETLKIGVTGNIETNGNCIILFIDSFSGGTNEITSAQTYTCGKLRSLAGLKLDFNPDFAIIANSYGGEFYVDFEELEGTSNDDYFGTGTGNIFDSRKLVHENSSVQIGFNDNNIEGVTVGSVAGAGSVSTGWEFDIPLNLIGISSPAIGSLKLQAIITDRLWEDNSATKRISNQSLPGVGNDSGIQGLLGDGSGGSSAVVTYNPDPPKPNQTCTITYNSAGRGLSAANPVYIHYGGNDWAAGAVKPRPIMTGTAGGIWSASVFVSNDWNELDCVFTTLENEDTGDWDDNDSADWKRAVYKGVVTYNPNPPVAGQTCFITYDSAGRNLATADPVYIHYGGNEWAAGAVKPRPIMTGTAGGIWSGSVFVSNDWNELDCVFTTLENEDTGVWDSNNGLDWKIGVQAGSTGTAGDYTQVSGNQFFEYGYDIIPEPGFGFLIFNFIFLIFFYVQKRK